MGNLLGSPVTEKETHVGVTKDEELKYGLSSMQGWRVHMEDAHIAEGDMYALEGTATRIPLKGHAVFAVYDGHGGTFAAVYSGNNFLRILSKQQHFIDYAKFCQQDEQSKEETQTQLKRTNSGTGVSPATNKNREAKKLDLLEKAFQQAFVETDYEIALAIRGKSHPDANTSYHPDEAPSATSATTIPMTTTNTTTSSVPGAAMKALGHGHGGAAMKASSDQASAVEDDGDSGTTACVVMITPTAIVCANAGDSRAIFARRNPTSTEDSNTNNNPNTHANNNCNKAIPLSFDHKPDDEAETKRIRSAGGYVAGGRVEGDLAVSRGLGDFRFKQMAVVLNNTQLSSDHVATTTTTTESENVDVTTANDQNMSTPDYKQYVDEYISNNASNQLKSSIGLFQPGEQKVSPIPDVIVRKRQPLKDEYIVVACDGIWDVLSNQQLVTEVDHIMYADGERDLGLISEEILDSCLRFGSKDNMTAIVIQLPACEDSYADAKSIASASKNPQDGVLGRRRKRDEHDHSASSQQQQQQQQHYDEDADDNNNDHHANDAPAVADAAAATQPQ